MNFVLKRVTLLQNQNCGNVRFNIGIKVPKFSRILVLNLLGSKEAIAFQGVLKVQCLCPENGPSRAVLSPDYDGVSVF